MLTRVLESVILTLYLKMETELTLKCSFCKKLGIIN